MAVSLDAILSATAFKMERVELPGDGIYVFVKELSSGDRDSYYRSLRKQSGDVPEQTQAKLLALTLVDDAGNRIAPGEDGWKKIAALPAQISDKLFLKAQKVNGLGRFAPSDEELEGALKNSETTTSAASASD